MVRKIFLKLFGVIDFVKDFLVNWGIKILIVIFILVILHNIIKISEISSRYQGEYKNLTQIYEEEKKFMNYYSAGEGDRTIVILPEFGAQSPVIQYKSLVDGLKDNYRVVVVEYFGYGFSMSMKDHRRSNENIVEEVKILLEENGIYGPYILLASDTSNIYAMSFQERYPDLVSSIIAVNGVYPSEVKNDFLLRTIRERISNVNINSIWELTGFERILSYVSEPTFYINEMRKLDNVYTKEEISVYRNRIGSSYLTRTMVREINCLEDNMNDMKNYSYPDYLPTLQILSSQKKGIYDAYKEEKNSDKDLVDLANGLITNSEIQKIETIEGDRQMLQLSNSKDLLNSIRSFLGY